MNKNLFVLLIAVTLSVNTAFAQVKKASSAGKKNIAAKNLTAQINPLIQLLPASDAVMSVQMSRLMNEALPQMLSSKSSYLQEFNSKIDEVKSNIGIDLRQFDQVAVGIAYKTVSEKETDYEPVILARGKFNSSAFLGLAKVAAKGKYREDRIGERTVYIFSPKELLADNAGKVKNSAISKMLDSLMKSFNKEIAVTTFDDQTLALGSINRVRQVFESKERINQDVVNLANKNSTSMLGFAANMPKGASQFLPIDNDELGKNINAIKQMYGGLNFNNGKANLGVSAKTEKAKDAEDLEQTLLGLQMVGKALLGGSKRADQQLYARMLENAVISRKVSEVSLNLTVPKTDMDALMGILLK